VGFEAVGLQAHGRENPTGGGSKPWACKPTAGRIPRGGSKPWACKPTAGSLRQSKAAQTPRPDPGLLVPQATAHRGRSRSCWPSQATPRLHPARVRAWRPTTARLTTAHRSS